MNTVPCPSFPAPIQVYWADKTYAIVRWRDVPDDVPGSWCAQRWQTIVDQPFGAYGAGPGRGRGSMHEGFYISQEIKGRYPEFFCKVRIADMRAALRPLERSYDGLTAEQCLTRYKCVQRDDKLKMTADQKKAAQDLWSKELAALCKASEIKERNRVVVDLDFEEWE